MRFGRFERKILIAIVAVAVVPMVGALVLGEGALREAYQVGVNARVDEQLQRGLSLYEAHFRALRDKAQQAATAIGHDHDLRDALARADHAAVQARLRTLLDIYDGVASARVVDGAWSTAAERPERRGEGMRTLDVSRPLGAGGATVELTLATPAAPFADYQRAGELAEVYARLADSGGEVSRFYLLVYMGFLAATIALAMAAGVVLSRRVTRRVLQLADATRRVGAGDLEVQVPTDADDEVGELTREFNAMVRDIRESRARIEYLQRIGAWQELARHLAHEIKNPLTPIQLAIQEVNRSYHGDDAGFRARLQDATTIVEEEVASLRRMVGEFSAFARLPVANLQPADLGDFLADATVTLSALPEEFVVDAASRHDADRAETIRSVVQVVPPDGRVPVAIDAMMLRRCLDNLVRNALQALRDAGRAGHVEVRGRTEDGWAVLEVRDDGPGIAEDHLPRVFDPYFTTKADGTGLGLPIVMKIVLEHHGELQAENLPGQGARVRIRLPQDRSEKTSKDE